MQIIYKIRNVTNDKFYVGSTADQRVRFQNHRRLLRKGKHHCYQLQAAWNKYGEACFRFEVIERIPDDADLAEAENVWLTAHVGEDHCYNTGRAAAAPWRGGAKEDHPAFGRPKSPETRAAISATLKEYYAADPANHPRRGKTHTEETRAKLREKCGRKGEANANYGKTLSAEQRKQIGDRQRGIKKGPKTYTADGLERLKAGAAWRKGITGAKLSAETRSKISKRVVELTSEREFSSLTAVLVEYGMNMIALQRALKSGRPITKGVYQGLHFLYSAHVVEGPAGFVVPVEDRKAKPAKGVRVAGTAEEAKARKSQAVAAGWANPDTRAKRIAGIKASRTPELRAQIGASCAALWDDEKRKEQSEKMKAVRARAKSLTSPKIPDTLPTPAHPDEGDRNGHRI